LQNKIKISKILQTETYKRGKYDQS
jgi:hypothetical protein